MHTLIIDDAALEKISALKTYAIENPFSIDDILDMYNKQKAPAGDMPEYCMYIDVGYRIVFSVEQQPAGDIYHMSISDNNNKYPHPMAIKHIVKLFGLKNDPEFDERTSVEQIDKDRFAINIFEFIN